MIPQLNQRVDSSDEKKRAVNHARLKVVYDTSVLGFGQYEESGRTGVYRLVESVANALVESDLCDLFFSASESFRMWVHADEFLSLHPQLSGTSRLHPGLSGIFYRAGYRPYSRLVSRGNPSFPLRALRRILGEGLSHLERALTPLSPSHLREKDIYHSPYWALPSSTRGIAGLKRFLTVHDILCITHPETGSDGGAFLKTIVGSATESDWVVCVSEATRNELLEFHRRLDPQKVFVIHSAASDLFRPCNSALEVSRVKKLYGLSGRPYLLSVCTLEKRKNMEHLVRCFAKVIKTPGHQDLDLVLAGSKSNSLPKILSLVQELKIPPDRVVIPGFIPDENLPALYSGAMAFVYPSIAEGFGFPPLEAMQCGVPVITSNTSSLPEVVGDAGLLVPPHDVDALCQAITALYGDSGLRQKLSAASLAQARKFSWKNNVTQLHEAYVRAVLS